MPYLTLVVSAKQQGSFSQLWKRGAQVHTPWFVQVNQNVRVHISIAQEIARSTIEATGGVFFERSFFSGPCLADPIRAHTRPDTTQGLC